MWDRSSNPIPSSAPGAPADTSAPDNERVTVNSRFGTVEIGPENRVYMPVGLLGFSDSHHFGLVGLPQPASVRVKLLQSIDDPELGFIVLPLTVEDGHVAPEDLEDAALSVGIAPETAAFLLIVTVRMTENGAKITANLRAPIVVDPMRSIARQVVMANSNYAIQFPL